MLKIFELDKADLNNFLKEFLYEFNSLKFSPENFTDSELTMIIDEWLEKQINKSLIYAKINDHLDNNFCSL